MAIRDENVIIEEHFQTAFYRLKKEIENTPKLPLKVSNTLTKPEPLIIAAQKDLKDKQPAHYYSNSKNIIYTAKAIISIQVAKQNIPRALRFKDTFIKLIKQRGHSIDTKEGSKVIVNGESIKIRFRKTLKRITTKHPIHDWNNTELIPSGILSYKIEAHWNEKEWRDSEKSPLESKLSSILAKLELEAQCVKKNALKMKSGVKNMKEKGK